MIQPLELSQKTHHITPSYTIGISSQVRQLKAEGQAIIDLSIGEPDFFTPEKAKQAGIEAIQANHTKYDLVPGLYELRLAICDKLKRENQVTYSVNEIVVSSGAKNALTNAFSVILNPGDEVIVPVPYWTSYPEIIKLCGGVPIYAETSKENGFKVTVDDLQSLITPKTKILLLNNPSNPTGIVYLKDELKAIGDFCVEKGLFIVADEIYERIHYTDQFTSVASLSDAIKNQTILINGHSKSVSMTGWRLGYTAAPEYISKYMSMMQGHLISHPSLITQYAGLSALTECESDIKQMVSTYKNRRDQLVAQLDTIPNISYVTPEGAFYLFLDISCMKDYLAGESLSLAFCDELLTQYKVAAVPGIAFGKDDHIRLSYATTLENAQEGLNRIKAMIESYTEKK